MAASAPSRRAGGTRALAGAHVVHTLASLQPKHACKSEQTQPTPLTAIFTIRHRRSPLHIGVVFLRRGERRCARDRQNGQSLDDSTSGGSGSAIAGNAAVTERKTKKKVRMRLLLQRR